MNRTKMIKKIIGESAENLGFYYKGASRDGNGTDYVFEKKKESEYEIEQSIWISIFNNYNGSWDIRLTFIGRDYIEGGSLIESKFQKGMLHGSLHFQSEEELEQILHLFKKIIEEKGEKIFSACKRSPEEIMEIQRKQNMHQRLYQERHTLNTTYRKMYGLENTQFTAKLIRTMCGLIFEKKDEKFEDVEEFLLGMAAIYGDQLIRRRGGEWVWDDKNKTCEVRGESGSLYKIPLMVVCWYWERKIDDYLSILGDFSIYPGETVI
ncbi:MAG: hypothetical protein ACXAHE_07715 [Roseburia sp. 1XD42-69]